MIDPRKIEVVGNATTGFAYIMMFVTLFLQIASFNFTSHIFMCSLITVLVLVGLICSIICKDKKEALIRSCLITFWLTNLIVNLIIH